MKKLFENKKLLITGVLVLELVLLVVNALRFYRHESYVYTSDDMILAYYDEAGGTFAQEPGFYADHSNKPRSVVYSPVTRLRKGIYSLTIDYSSNGGSWHEAYAALVAADDPTDEGKANVISCDRADFKAGDHSMTLLSWVHYGADCSLRMGPEEGSAGDEVYVLINGASITYMAGKTVCHETVKLLFVLMLLDLLLYLYFFRKKETMDFIGSRVYIAAGILFIIFFSSFQLMVRNIYFGDDIFYHLRRIAFLAEGLQAGYFPVKIQGGWDNGYGYAVGVGYSDAFLYPSAILVCLGFSVQLFCND